MNPWKTFEVRNPHWANALEETHFQELGVLWLDDVYDDIG